MTTAIASAGPTRASSLDDGLFAGAPVSGWRRLAGDSLLVTVTGVACQVLAICNSLILRMVLNPAQMGIWQTLKLLLAYANYANLGISKGATRELAIAEGRGNPATAQRGLNLAFAVNTLGSLAYGGVLAAAAIWIALSAGGRFAGPWTVGLLAVALMVTVQRHVTFHVTILRCRQVFAATSRLAVVEGALTLVVATAAAWMWGLGGLYWGTLAVMVGSYAYLRYGGIQPLRWAWDRPEIGRLIGMGGPMLLAGAGMTLFQSLDKLMILSSFPDREYQLGCYSLALLVSGQIYGLANMTSLAWAPRLAELFGRKGGRRNVAVLAARTSELQAAVLALLGGMSIVLAAPVLGGMLPDYQAGLSAALGLVPGAIALGLALPASQYLTAVQRERRWLAVVVAATLLASITIRVALSCGQGIGGVAWATSLAQVGYLALVVRLSFWPELSRRDRRRYLFGVLLTLAPTLGVAALIAAGHPVPRGDWLTLVGQAFVVLAVWSLTMAAVWRWGGWATIWREERSCRDHRL